MKLITLIFLISLSAIGFCQSIEDAREVKIVQMEYNETSKKGVLRIGKCHRCSYEIYNFSASLSVEKNNLPSELSTLLKEYWDVRLATIFIKPNTNKLTGIAYYK